MWSLNREKVNILSFHLLQFTVLFSLWHMILISVRESYACLLICTVVVYLQIMITPLCFTWRSGQAGTIHKFNNFAFILLITHFSYVIFREMLSSKYILVWSCVNPVNHFQTNKSRRPQAFMWVPFNELDRNFFHLTELNISHLGESSNSSRRRNCELVLNYDIVLRRFRRHY